MFAQNLRSDDRFRPGDQVRLHWSAANAFGLDGDEDPLAGQIIDPELAARRRRSRDPRGGPRTC